MFWHSERNIKSICRGLGHYRVWYNSSQFHVRQSLVRAVRPFTCPLQYLKFKFCHIHCLINVIVLSKEQIM